VNPYSLKSSTRAIFAFLIVLGALAIPAMAQGPTYTVTVSQIINAAPPNAPQTVFTVGETVRVRIKVNITNLPVTPPAYKLSAGLFVPGSSDEQFSVITVNLLSPVEGDNFANFDWTITSSSVSGHYDVVSTLWSDSGDPDNPIIYDTTAPGSNTGHTSDDRVHNQFVVSGRTPVVEYTLYRVSDNSGTANTSNPGVAKTGFKAGDVIRITMKAVNTGGSTSATEFVQIPLNGQSTEPLSGYTIPAPILTDGGTKYLTWEWTVPQSPTYGWYDIKGAVWDPVDVDANIYDTTAAGAANTGWGVNDRILKAFAIDDGVAPTVTITSPTANATFTTSAPTINLSGTASDVVGVASVTWADDHAHSGTATGTTLWSISSIPLQSGSNVITVTATDLGGDTGTDTITVTYTPNSATACYQQGFDSGTTGWTKTGLWHASSACSAASAGHSSPTAFFFGQDTGCNYNTGVTVAGALVSPQIDLTASSAPVTLKFKYFLGTERVAAHDQAKVEVYDGTSWSQLDTDITNGGTLVDTAAWTEGVYDLAPYVGYKIKVRFSFDSVDASSNNHEGFYVDDFRVLGSCLLCGIPYDFSRDGNSDLLWRNSVSGQVLLWKMAGSDYSAFQTISPTIADSSWQIVGQGDFNADGKADILWRNASSGQTLVWFMDGTTFSSFQNITPTIADPNWKIVAVGDFNSDSKPDILWRNSSTGQTVVWQMDGTTFSNFTTITPTIADASWKIVGTGDFDGDGKTDLLWRNSVSGQAVVWLMNGTTFSSFQTLSPTVTDASWSIVGAADLTGDNKPDIIWRSSTTGQNVLWTMDGTTFTSFKYITPAIADPTWNIVGPK
jgi:hypothetical protein